MSWLTPLGFLGLIGLIILILIYIIKPNYQNKIISSTFIWKLSLKYKKKKIPISKLRNILLFLCQILAITVGAMILAQPYIDNSEPKTNEKVMIIDASGSMMSTVGGQTRFERALDEVRAEAEAVLGDPDGRVSIILASTSASFVVQQTNNLNEIKLALEELMDPANLACTYGKVDIEAAIKLAEEVTANTPDVEVQLYTDTAYIDPGKVVIKSVRDISDWNASILDVRGILDENKYRFEIDVACFGKNADIDVYATISGVNGEGDTIELQAEARCIDGETQTLVFSAVDVQELNDLFSYTHVYVHVEEVDALDVDNSFYLYGGEKPTLRIQYHSKAPNNYISSAMLVIRSQLKYRWNVEFVEVEQQNGKPATEGFDLYIYEHEMPSTVPTDGVVLLINPDSAPSNAGFRLGRSMGSGQQNALKYLSANEEHDLLRGLTPEAISVSKYTTITSYDGYTSVLYVDENPVFIVKNEPNQKIGVLSFSLNYSNLPVMLEFPMMMYNIIEYFIPSTMTEYVFDVNETITLGARSEELNVVGNGLDTTITEFPAELLLVKPGVYTVSQTPLSGVDVIENFYVKIPAAESDINAQKDSLKNPYMYSNTEESHTDLLLYFAIALVVLLFCEWWLNTREQY